MITHERKIAIQEEVAKGLPPLYADPELCVQVLNNLLDNALRYARTKVRVLAEASADVRRVRFSVMDDGKGIPPDRVGDLFNKFVQVDRSRKGDGYKGTGLGLAICKEIVERQEGRIWVESVEGRGSAFRFELPAQSAGPTKL